MKKQTYTSTNGKTAKIFDLDGVLIDSLNRMYTVYSTAVKTIGHTPLGFEDFRTTYDGGNWKALYPTLGNQEFQEKILAPDSAFRKLDKELPPANFIPNARKTLYTLSKLPDLDLYVVSNSPESTLDRVRDLNIFTEVHRCEETKTKTLEEISSKYSTTIFTGDSVSDGEACIDLAEQNSNIKFLALGHRYCTSPREKLKRFTQKHNWAHYIDNIGGIKEWTEENLKS